MQILKSRLLLACCLLFASPVAAFSAWDRTIFETREYSESTGLAAVDAAGAYSLGFTGKGVVIGFVDDSVAPGRGEFAGKYPYGVFGDFTPGKTHGIHVSGIMAARKDDIGMHGVAFDASLLPLADLDDVYRGWRLMLQYPDVKIINNSWGDNIHLDVDYADGFWGELLNKNKDLIPLANEMAAQDKLVVMPAGNEGHLGPAYVSGLPSLFDREGVDHAIGNNWLNIAAFDPRYESTHPAFVAAFTNLGQGASEYTLLAPGVNIYSTLSAGTYGLDSGTSMAAPYVSGVAALVQEAFPYMGGKQMADVLLSTASPLGLDDLPKYFVLIRDEYDENEGFQGNNVIVYTTDAGFSSEDGEIAAIAEQLDMMGDFRDELEDALQAPEVLSEEAYAELFGQGIVNAYRAVQGPGLLNANRLDDVADRSTGEFGGDFALYSVDSKGFDSIWSNDIGERRADEGALWELPVGLRKSGAGMLYLTGANSYQGPTVVQGGGISLGREGYSGASVYSDVYVLSSGLFTGNGVVGCDPSDQSSTFADVYIEFGGVLMPGLEGQSGSTLVVAGDVENAGVTRFVLGQDGQGNRLEADGDITLSGALEVMGSKGAPIRPYHDYTGVAQAGGNLDIERTTPITVSPFLSFSPVRSGQTLSLMSRTNALDSIAGVPRRVNAVNSALEHMFHALGDSPQQRRMDFLYNQSAEGLWDIAASLRGDVHAATLTTLPLQGRLRSLAASRSNLRWKGRMPEPSAIEPAFSGTAARGSRNIWLQPIYGYDSIDGKSSIRQENVHSRTIGLAGGVEAQADNAYGGLLVAVGHADVDQGAAADAEIYDTRAALYGGWSPGAFRLEGLVSAGWQVYDVSRRIPVPDAAGTLQSRFHGYSVGLGLEAGWDMLHGTNDGLSLTPFIGFDADYIRQESRKETGDAVFALDVDGKGFWRTSVNPGIELGYTPEDWLSLFASAGYRRILSGDSPNLDVGFRADSSYRFTAASPDEGRDFVTFSLGADARLPDNVTVSARFSGEESGSSRHYGGFFSMSFAW